MKKVIRWEKKRKKKLFNFAYEEITKSGTLMVKLRHNKETINMRIAKEKEKNDSLSLAIVVQFFTHIGGL